MAEQHQAETNIWRRADNTSPRGIMGHKAEKKELFYQLLDIQKYGSPERTSEKKIRTEALKGHPKKNYNPPGQHTVRWTHPVNEGPLTKVGSFHINVKRPR